MRPRRRGRCARRPPPKTCPDASFAGQQETFLNINGLDNILHAIHEVFASLYNDRAIAYRVHQGFAHDDVALSAGVQRMVRSDVGASGVMFTLDTESGFDQVVFITASYGLGETVVQGAVNPDEFYLYKPNLAAGRPAILRKTRRREGRSAWCSPTARAPGARPSRSMSPTRTAIASRSPTPRRTSSRATRSTIEKHYGRPMDIEWGRDGIDGKLYILQARPETVKSRESARQPAPLPPEIEVRGARERPRDRPADRAGRGAPGQVGGRDGPGQGGRRARRRHDRSRLGAGDEARGGDRHQSRRAHLPRGDHRARARHSGGRRLRRRDAGAERWRARSRCPAPKATPATSTQGILDVEIVDVALDRMPPSPTKIMMNVGNPELAFEFRRLPNEGVGLARLEFIINKNVGIHPKALIELDRQTPELQREIRERIAGYASPTEFYVEQDRRRRGDDRRRVLAEEGDRAAVRLQVERVLEPRRRPALRAARGESDARLPRRVALHRAGVPRLLRARMRGDEARPRRHGIHQRRADDPVRAHARRGASRSSRCWRSRGSRAATTACASS